MDNLWPIREFDRTHVCLRVYHGDYIRYWDNSTKPQMLITYFNNLCMRMILYNKDGEILHNYTRPGWSRPPEPGTKTGKK